MQALAIIWNIQPAPTTSSSYITSSVISDTICKAQALEQCNYIQLYKLIIELYFQFSSSQEGEERLILIKRKKQQIRQKPNTFIKLS